MINLGDKKWGVKDSGLLAYKQVGSKFFNKDFDFTRSSDATYIDKNGVLQTQSLYNLTPYSQDFSQWTAQSGITLEETTETYDPNGQYNAYKVISTNPSSGFYRTGLSMNFDVTRSIYMKGVNGGETCQIKDGSGFGGLANITLTNEWVRYEFTTLYDGNTFQGMFIDDISSDIYIYGAQLVEGTEPLDYQYTNGRVGIPRIDFSDGVGSLLLEPQRSNLLLQSNSFDTTWATTNSSVTSGQDGVYGTNDAWLLSKSAASGRLYQNLSASGVLTFSVYMKANASAWGLIQVDGSPNDAYAYVDLQNGTIGTTSSANIIEGIEDIGNGWHRVFVSLNDVVTRVRIYPADGNGNVGGTSGSIYIQHAQLESGSYPTSTIETTTSQVTRIADVANNCGTEQDFNSEEGVLYGEILKRQNDNDNFILISINDGSGNDQNSVTIGFDGDNDSYARIKANNTNIFISQNLDTNRDEYYKIALKYNSSGDNALWINGSEVLSNTTSFAFANPLNRLDFAYDSDYILPFYGKVKNLQVFTEALSDEELENLTT